MLLAFGPRGVHALQRAPRRRRVHVAPRGDAQHDVVPAADARSSIAPAKPSGTSRAPRTATGSGRTASRPQSPGPAARRPRAQRRPPGTGWAGGRGVGQPVAPAAHHVHADVQRVLCARLRLKNQRRQLGLRAYSMTPGATRLSKLVAARSPQRLLAVAVPHSACKICTLPAKVPHRHPVQLAQCALPSCAARVFCLSAAPGFPLRLPQLQENLDAKPARRWPLLYSWLSASHHLRSTLVLLRQLSDPGAPPQPQPAVRGAQHGGGLSVRSSSWTARARTSLKPSPAREAWCGTSRAEAAEQRHLPPIHNAVSRL